MAEGQAAAFVAQGRRCARCGPGTPGPGQSTPRADQHSTRIFSEFFQSFTRSEASAGPRLRPTAPHAGAVASLQQLLASGPALSNFRRWREIVYTMTTRRTRTETGVDLLLRAAQRRASVRSQVMAWLLTRAQSQQGCSEAQLVAQLGLSPGQLPQLALCFKPPTGRPLRRRRRRHCSPVRLPARRPGRPRAAGHRRRALQRLTPPGAATTRHDAATAAFCNYGLPYLRFCAFTAFCIHRFKALHSGQQKPSAGGVIFCLRFVPASRRAAACLYCFYVRISGLIHSAIACTFAFRRKFNPTRVRAEEPFPVGTGCASGRDPDEQNELHLRSRGG
jgi:hypothetical protein